MIVVCFLLQVLLLNLITGVSIRPNILLILTVSIGLMRGKHTGLWVGLISGLILDLFTGTVFGVNAILYMYMGYINGKLYKVFYDDDIKVPLVFVTLNCFIYNIIYYIILFILNHRFVFKEYMRYNVVPEILYTILFTIILYKLFYHINHKLVANELEENDSPWLIK